MATQSEGAASSLSEELSGGQAVPILVGGLLGGFIAASIALSLASLIFSGPMSDGLGVAISASLIGGSVVAIVSGLYGSSPGMISGVQDSIAAVIAAATAVVATTAAPGTEVATAFAAVGLTTIAFGATLWAAGRWRLGRALQFVPYPVILGFIGATGIVIFQGALGVLSPRGAAVLDDLAILVPGLVLGAVMYAITRWSGSKYGVPVLIVGAAAAINLWANLGPGRDAAVEEGWFLGPFAQGQALDLLIMREVVNADWSALGSQIAVLLTAVAVGVIGFLLNAPAVAETTGADIDVDLDLGPTGLANVAAGMIGGLPGFLLLSDSVAVYKIAGLSRLAGVFTGIVGLGVAVAGTSLFSAIPTALVGGVLVFIAFNFLDDALGSSWAAVSRLDYGLITAMTLGVLVFGFGAAIVLGLLGAVLLFVFRYAQITVVNRDLDVMDYPGLVDRSPEERQALESASSRGRILELEGFVFFGTARQIAERVTNMDAAVDYVVVDTSRVKGIDSSAAATIRKAFRDLDAIVAISACHSDLDPSLVNAVVEFDDVAAAVTWVEDQLLDSRERAVTPLEEVLASLGQPDTAATLRSYFDLDTVPAGEIILQQGTKGTGLYYIESGSCSIIFESEQGSTLVRRLAAGTFVGEISMYGRQDIATASVVAETECRLGHLPPSELQRLEREAPAAASLLHRIIAGTLATRLRYSNSMIRALRQS